MIYLFDDNRFGQMSLNYDVDYLRELPKYATITHFQKHGRDTEGYDFLQNAQAVFIHDSFPNGDDYGDSEHRKEIVARSKYRKIPYVVFSNQFSSTVFDEDTENSIKALKKDRFYFNLLGFLQSFGQTGKLKLEQLAIGIAYEREKTYIIEDRLGALLLEQGEGFSYENTIKVGSEPHKDIMELFYFIDGDEQQTVFLAFDLACLENQITAKDLKKQIKILVEQIRSEEHTSELQSPC